MFVALLDSSIELPDDAGRLKDIENYPRVAIMP
jgi:hypothetical protein